MTTISISSKFQCVIPKETRRLLNIQPFQRFDLRVENGCVVLEPQQPMKAARGYALYPS